MKKILGICIITLLCFGECFASEENISITRSTTPIPTLNTPDNTLQQMRTIQKSLGPIETIDDSILKPLKQKTLYLQSDYEFCTNQIDESVLTGTCDVSSITTTLNTLSGCLNEIDLGTKDLKTQRDKCITSFEQGDEGLNKLQETYDQLYSGLIQSEQSFLNGTHMYQDKLDDYKSSTLNKIGELESYNNRIQELKQNIQQCKQYYNDIQDLQKDIKNTMGDIEKQQKSLTKAENKNQKKKDKNSNQEARKLGTTSKSVEKAENKRKEKDEKADYVLNQTCLSARDFLYTLKYGTTMKKGNPGNDLIENRSPREMLDKVVYDANAIDQYQETAMDGVTSRDESCVNGGGRITNTLCWVKNHIHPYIQWIVYLGLTLSVILLIYNGFKMVTNVMHGEGDFGKIKTNILYIGLGIIILTGFYYLLDIVMAIINFLFD